MYRETETYTRLRKTGALPIVFAVLASSQNRRFFGQVWPAEWEMGDAPIEYFDGAHTVGDGGRFGGDLPIIDWRACTLNFGSITETIAPQTADLIASFSQTAIGALSVSFDNADGYFSNLLSETQREPILLQSLSILQGFAGCLYADLQPLFTGEIRTFTLTDKQLSVTAEASGVERQILTLPKSGQYAHPGEENLALPIIYGDMTENSSGGVSVCPCIDTVNHVYAIACHAILTEVLGNVINVYVDNVLIAPTAYSVTAFGDYEGLGEIAYLTFAAAPTGTVTISCKGKMNSDLALITNPIDVVADLLSMSLDFIDGFFYTLNRTAFATARTVASAAGYTAAGVIVTDKELAYWLTAILSCFLGDWYLNNQQEFVFQLDAGAAVTNTAAILRQHVTTTVSASQSADHLCNRVSIDYGLCATQLDRRFKEGININANTSYFQTDGGAASQDAISIAKYGLRKRSLQFDWTRNTATVNRIQQLLVTRFAEPVFIVNWTAADWYDIQAEKGDYVLYAWEHRRGTGGYTYAQILSKTIDLDNHTLSFQLRDTGAFLPYPVYAPQYDARIKLLIHSNTTEDGNTHFADSSQSQHTVTAFGDAHHATAHAVFGYSAIALDGNGDYLSASASDDWDFGAGDFTVDFRLRMPNQISVVVVSWVREANTGGWCIYLNEGQCLGGQIFIDGGWHVLGNTAYVTPNVWHHVALTRSGSSFRIFLDGYASGNGLTSASVITQTAAPVPPLLIGAHFSISPSYFTAGEFEEIRIVKGLAVWTANFTPPTAMYQPGSL